MRKPVYICWLEGMDPQCLTHIPALSSLAAQGVDLRIEPLPLVEQQQCYYQMMTGMGPGKFGRFDGVRPDNYQARATRNIPAGVVDRQLPELLSRHGRSVLSLDISSDVSTYEAVSKKILILANQVYDVALTRLLNAEQRPLSEITLFLNHWLELVPSHATLYIMTGVWSPAPHTLVNVNDVLAEAGLLSIKGDRQSPVIDWSTTLAYYMGTGQIWLNLRGRETNGVVRLGRDYKRVCDRVIQILQDWRDPRTNEPVVAMAVKKDAIFTGEYLFKAPDIVVTFQPGYAASPCAQSVQVDGQSVQPVKDPDEVHNSTPHARLLAYGSDIRRGYQGKAALVDIVPTVLHMADVPLPRRLDGNVIPELCSDYDAANLSYIDDEEEPLTPVEVQKILGRLRTLGYLS